MVFARFIAWIREVLRRTSAFVCPPGIRLRSEDEQAAQVRENLLRVSLARAFLRGGEELKPETEAGADGPPQTLLPEVQCCGKGRGGWLSQGQTVCRVRETGDAFWIALAFQVAGQNGRRKVLYPESWNNYCRELRFTPTLIATGLRAQDLHAYGQLPRISWEVRRRGAYFLSSPRFDGSHDACRVLGHRGSVGPAAKACHASVYVDFGDAALPFEYMLHELIRMTWACSPGCVVGWTFSSPRLEADAALLSAVLARLGWSPVWSTAEASAVRSSCTCGKAVMTQFARRA